ncbi:MAG: PEGA domain-containing protein [Thermoguttaceae bacterium]|nr:PEGA domain-containing protein [Thermoguttaceae bacterium]
MKRHGHEKKQSFYSHMESRSASGLQAARTFAFRWCVIGVLCMLSGVGCVQRRLTIRSNPPGAVVYVDNQEIGTTPISTNFLFYGQRHIRLVKDGYEEIDEMREIRAPWYQLPVVDMVSETVVPGEIQDRRTLQYTLKSKQQTTGNQLLNEAEQFRATTRSPSASIYAPSQSLAIPSTAAGGGQPMPPASGLAPNGTVSTIPTTPDSGLTVPTYSGPY